MVDLALARPRLLTIPITGPMIGETNMDATMTTVLSVINPIPDRIYKGE